MITGYEIREILRPDGRTIWRLVEIHEYCVVGKNGRDKYENSIAAFDTEESAKEYLAEIKRRDAEIKRERAKQIRERKKETEARIAEFKANCGKKKRKIGGWFT